MKKKCTVLLLFACLLVAAPCFGHAKQRPNILYIFTDDQSVRSVSCYPQSQPWANTPNIDRLAAAGVRFSYCYTGAKCVPSRGNALTGKLQFNYTRDTVYWPVQFRKQGYFTGMIGKWHWNVPRHDETWDWSAVWEHHLPGNMRNYYWHQSLRINGDKLLPIGYSTDSYTELTLDFIRDRAKQKDKPWFFWLCYGAVHGPYTPADRHELLYLDQPETEVPVDVFGPRNDKPEHMVNMSMWKRAKKTGNWTKLICDKKTGTPSWLMLRRAQYKYIRYMQPNYQEELYDLKRDPDELRNLAATEGHHNLLADLRRATEKAFRARGASFIDLLPAPKVISK